MWWIEDQRLSPGVEGNNLVVQPMQLENLTDQCVTFRIKVTAPDRYSVRPSSGLLMAGENFEVQGEPSPGETAPAAGRGCVNHNSSSRGGLGYQW